MKRILFVITALVSLGAWAQNANGGISSEMLSTIRKGYSDTPSNKAVRNALAGQSIAVLAVNADNAAMIDTHFSNVVPTKGITDQKSSGRCWLFTGLNVLRAKMIATHDLGEFTLSQNYCSFYDLLEKSNLFLQAMIDNSKLDITDRKVDWLFQNPIGDGGQFTGVSNLIMKYGVVPSDIMPETYQSNNTSEMRTILGRKLRQWGLELREMKAADAQKRKLEMLTEMYGILAKCLGVPPTEFEWTRYDSKGNFVSRKTYTPQSFYNEFIGQDLENNYIMVMNDPSREYYKTYEIEYDRHVYDGDNWVYVNLPIERIKEMAIASIKDSTAMYFSCDVRKFANTTKGTLDLANMDYESLFDTDFPMDKKQRIQTYASGSSHAMTLIAVDIDSNGQPQKWMVENSWGAASGYKGNLIMTDEWFNEYMFRLVLEKKYVPSDILKLMDKKPVMLPSWDPMFLPED